MLIDRRWERMSARRFDELKRLDDASRDSMVAVLPLGATEQHGPHLPVSVDSAILGTIVERTIDSLPDETPATFLPLLPIGKSDEHSRYAGTLTLSAETLLRVIGEIGNGVASSGFRKLVLLNSHGGQVSVLDIAARELRVKHGMAAVVCNWWSLGLPDGLYPPDELKHGIHAGALETSIMLAAHDDQVEMERAERFEPLSTSMEADYERLGPLSWARGGQMAWQAQDLHLAGACGDASAATAEAGEATLQHTVAGLVELLAEVSRLPMAVLANEPDLGR
ncbi:MAG: creatininase family protein [Planctomycetota bacterium]